MRVSSRPTLCAITTKRAFTLLAFLLLVLMTMYSNLSYKIDQLEKVVSTREKVVKQLTFGKRANYPIATSFDRKDWHDRKFIEYEMSRVGPGEQGEGHALTDPKDIELNEKISQTEGLFAIVSDRISVNRSLPDFRLPKCKRIHYLKSLPSTSIIIIFHNEHLSLLLRAIHSVYNRTPRELLHQILIVNDASTKPELYEPLQSLVEQNFDERVKIVNLEERKGLIVTRMEGARRATGEVLVFLDSHMEVNVNWLPPLLEPIALDPKTSTVPVLDYLSRDTFKYNNGGQGCRGVFDWNFIYRCLPRAVEDQNHPEKAAPMPIMLGGVFAIRKDYFFDLGGYDEQLMIWNGENYELSFKLWLCGGKLLEIPCSRVGHVFRSHNLYRKKEGIDFVAHNFKRIAEVWLDDYKKFLYRNEPERYAKVDAGDLSEVKRIKNDLNCKPFKHFLDYVMPDMLERYPLESPGIFASGAIQSEADLSLCLDTGSIGEEDPVELRECGKDLINPEIWQNFLFTWNRQIKANDVYEMCIDSYDCALWECSYKLGTQTWIYEPITHQLIHSPNRCLTAKVKTRSLGIQPCQPNDIRQKWRWGYLNESAINNWKSFGVKLSKKMLRGLQEIETQH